MLLEVGSAVREMQTSVKRKWMISDDDIIALVLVQSIHKTEDHCVLPLLQISLANSLCLLR